MSTLWFRSDDHFGHDKLAREIRGFETVEDHDEALIEWNNNYVRPDDTVFCLGDFSLKGPSFFAPILSRLNGHWHLISGNHDGCWSGHREGFKNIKSYIDAGFESVQPFLRRKIDGEQVLMSHFPYTGDHTELQRYTQYRLRNEGLALLHGHTHSSEIISYVHNVPSNSLQIHVGLDAWNLNPVNIDQVVQILRQERAHEQI